MSPFKSKSQQRFLYSQKPKLAEKFSKETKNMKKLPEKADDGSLGGITGADGSPLFQEHVPRMLSTQDVFMNLKKSPEIVRPGLEFTEEDTLMGRLAKRMASRDFIDKQNLGMGTAAQKASKATTADGAEINRLAKKDAEAAKNALIEENIQKHGSKKDKKMLGMADGEVEKAPQATTADQSSYGGNALPKKMTIEGPVQKVTYGNEGFLGRQAQTIDLTAENQSDPIKFDGALPGSNMAEQAKLQGNVIDTRFNSTEIQRKHLVK